MWHGMGCKGRQCQGKVWFCRLFILFVSLCQSNEVFTSMSGYATSLVKTNFDDVKDENDAKGFSAPHSNDFSHQN
jgi:hypothetical protein